MLLDDRFHLKLIDFSSAKLMGPSPLGKLSSLASNCALNAFIETILSYHNNNIVLRPLIIVLIYASQMLLTITTQFWINNIVSIEIVLLFLLPNNMMII